MVSFLDGLYIVFSLVHLLASVLIDGQVFYPPHLVPNALKQVVADYLRDSNDPLIRGVWNPDHRWFLVSVASELIFQVPCFIAAIVGLYNNNRKVYPILIAYSTLASITTIQCLVSVLFGPEIKNLTSSNLVALLSGYVPFAVVPIIMMVDMTIRTTNLIGQVEEKEKDRKRR